MERVLVTTDLSPSSFGAFVPAAQEARKRNAEISLVTVVADWPVPSTFHEYIPEPERIEAYRRERQTSAATRLRRIAAESFQGLRVHTEAILSVEMPAAVISSYAHEHGCALIVLATHGNGSPGSRFGVPHFFGSVVQRVLKTAPCPVLVVPGGAGETAAAPTP